MNTLLPRRLLVSLGVVGIGSAAVGIPVGGIDYVVNILASVTGFCAAAAVLAPMLAAYEARRLHPIWQLLSMELLDDLLTLWQESFPSSAAGRGGILGEVQALGGEIEELGLLRAYTPGLRPTWMGQVEDVVETDPEKVHAQLERLQRSIEPLRHCRLEILARKAEAIAMSRVPEVVAVSYDAGLATGARELMAAVRWLTDTWWIPIRGASADENLRQSIRRLDQQKEILEEEMRQRGAGSGELREVATAATFDCDEAVVLMDKARWVLVQIYVLSERVSVLRTEKERIINRWPFKIGVKYSLSGVIADVAHEYKPVLLPSDEDVS
ncbi:hypothetical protein ACFWFI_02485 [Streptomyces sp. NPDC060209]|uniref:hypothetical protein n=1 Tax=Streptomyces sp. NPDC060209 TaxID=3347073 RepID=UPI003649D8F1